MVRSLELSRMGITQGWARIPSNLGSTKQKIPLGRTYSVVFPGRRRSGGKCVNLRDTSYSFCLFSSLLASAGTTFKATTTLAAETSNNTSAADSFAAQTNGNIGATNISKAPTRNLLYPGSTAKIYAHLVPWFGFGDHANVGRLK